MINLVVIRAKDDKPNKTALDSKLHNDANIMESVAKYISDNKNSPGKFLFSKIDLKYAYSQIPIHAEIRKHCKLNVIRGKSNGTYQFVNGFYGFSNMSATFQKTLVRTLEYIHNKFNVLDEILIINELDIDKVLARLDKENLAIKSKNANLHNQTSHGSVTNYPIGHHPTVKKTDSILNLKPLNTFKQHRFLINFIHNLANKSRQSRLSHYIDKLLPSIFTINHIPGKDMGFTD